MQVCELATECPLLWSTSHVTGSRQRRAVPGRPGWAARRPAETRPTRANGLPEPVRPSPRRRQHAPSLAATSVSIASHTTSARLFGRSPSWWEHDSAAFIYSFRATRDELRRGAWRFVFAAAAVEMTKYVRVWGLQYVCQAACLGRLWRPSRQARCACRLAWAWRRRRFGSTIPSISGSGVQPRGGAQPVQPALLWAASVQTASPIHRGVAGAHGC